MAAHVAPVGRKWNEGEDDISADLEEMEHLEEAAEVEDEEANVAPQKAAKQASLAPPDTDTATFYGIPMKWLSLVLLTLQTSGQALLIRWSRSQGGQAKYLSSTVVFFTEVLKVLCSIILVIMESKSASEGIQTLVHHFTESPWEVAKAAVPALIYTIQNNLMFYSFDKLSAPVQQVLYQMKILTTAGLGVVMLGKSLTATKWGSCFMLTIGIVLVQWPRHSPQVPGAETGIGSDQVKGFTAVLLACVTSGFAAVFIQKMLQQTTASIWVRNVQFGLFGSIMGLLVAFGHDGTKILQDGFLQGYSSRTVAVICMNAFGGLLCAVMLKYAGATLGCFSTALSIILTCVLSWAFLQDFVPDGLFLLGTGLAIAASLLYGLGLPESLVGRLGMKGTL